MRNFLDENPENDGIRIKSMEDINEQLYKVKSKEELQDIMKKLHFKSKERPDPKQQNSDYTSTLQAMDDLKAKAEEIENQELDLSRIYGKILLIFCKK